MALGVMLLMLGGVEVLAGFLLRIHRLRRGGGLVVGALVTAVVGALLMTGHASTTVAVLAVVVSQVLVVASYLGVRRATR